jgi:uncharacterized membrane protein YjdF
MTKTPTEEYFRLSENRIHKILISFFLILMAVEWVLLFLDERWLALFLVTMIIAALLSPVLFRKKLQIEIPAEFHITAVIFIFASFYLGEVQDFYYRIWWWDIALHASAGLLMGILGFLLIYILNESKSVDLYMTPGFIAFFAFTFAVTIGTVWEIFEFGMDQLLGTTMQKPMFGDPSGLTDTMWDMIVNAIGALVISTAGYWYLKRDKDFFVKEWIRKFVQKNPGLFRKQ